MKQSLFLFVTATILVFSCKTVRKTQVIQAAITKKDTTPVVIIKESPKVDSVAIVRDIMSKVVRRKISFNTFNAKIKVNYEGPEKSNNFTVYLGMKKDSIILIKVTGTFSVGIPGVGLEAKINRDSVTVVFHQGEKYVMNRPISYLKEVIEIPFDFSTIQDLIIGNPIFIDSNIVSYRAGPNQLSVLMIGDLFKHLLTMDNVDFKALHSKLDDVDIQRNRTGDITFSNYEKIGPYQFATYRSISIAEKTKLNLYLDFKEYALNEPLKYNFEVPKKLKRK